MCYVLACPFNDPYNPETDEQRYAGRQNESSIALFDSSGLKRMGYLRWITNCKGGLSKTIFW